MQVTNQDISNMANCISSMWGGCAVNLSYDFWRYRDGEGIGAWKLYISEAKDSYRFETWEQLRAWVHGQDTDDSVLIGE